MKPKKNTVLVLGSQGMLGRVIFELLNQSTNINCVGTAKKKTSKFLKFDANKMQKSLEILVKKTKPDYVVNTIGLLRTYPSGHKPQTRDYNKINIQFPLFLEKRAGRDNFKLIHVSTDCVFSANHKAAKENDFTSPKGKYCKSKLNGEVTGDNSLTIRTSIVGYDPRRKKGILEMVINSKNNIKGFSNHTWSGATTLQVATLIDWLITNKGFNKIKKNTPILHYAPLGPFSKLFLIKNIASENGVRVKVANATDKVKISRYLSSKYQNLLPKRLLVSNIVANLKYLKEFESSIKKSKMAKRKKKLAFVLGIRPDIIRAALIMNYLKKAKDIEVIFIWSGQHYDDNLKGIFFRELGMPKPDYDLGCSGSTDAEISGQLISKLYPALEKIKPDAVAFLGDTNTTVGCIAVAQLNIPIIHIEGCWRSYDWRMPEDKYRTMVDQLSDVIYTYEEEYKIKGMLGGLNPRNIVVVRNPIVDILNKFYFGKKQKLKKKASLKFFRERGIKKGKYYLMTCHRRENVHIKKSFLTIMNLVESLDFPVYFPASYRTQKVMDKMKFDPPKNLIIVDPIGYEEILILMTNSKAVLTDSGTIVEETSILNIPTVQIRKSTERPQVYDVGGCVKFDPDQPDKYPPKLVMKKLDKIKNKKWQHTLGDGKSSERIANDLIRRLRENDLRGHLPENSHLPITRSFMEDGIEIN